MATPPPIVFDECARLQALREYGVLDSPAEEEYDDQAKLAAEFCETPIALVSLVDEHRQWFKARVGLEATETLRTVSFCHYTLEEGRLLEIEDATKDARFRDSTLVTGPPHIRFYAGAPLVTPAGYIVGTLCVIDSKPRTLAERQRRALQSLARTVMMHLEQRRLSRRLSEKAEENQRLYLQKSELLGMIAHDIRGQISGILGLNETIREHEDGARILTDEECREFRREISANCHLTLQALGELLSAESLHASRDVNKLRPSRLVMAEVIERVRERNIGHATRKQCRLQLDYEPNDEFVADVDAVIEILDNLISNGVKYSPPGSTITLVATLEAGNSVRFIVQDQGPGFSAEDQAKLFGRFQRLSARPTSGEPSTGLGLSIVKHFVDLHGGTISLDSTSGKGARFTVHLPLLTPLAAAK